MDKQKVLINTYAFVKKEFLGEGTGHDYFHLKRVVENALKIGKAENANLFLVELSAWLHDVGDYKLHDGVDRSEELVKEFLLTQNLSDELIDKVNEIISQVSFSKGNSVTSLEAKVVQDADRLDAIGAIGIARAFAFGGSRGRELWNPDQPESTTVQHFYDKLLKLKDLMNTETAKVIAEKRHRFLEEFLRSEERRVGKEGSC